MEENSPPSQRLSEEGHNASAALVGRYVQVDYPGRGVLNGLLTGYYRETGFFRIDYFPNAARLRSDTGVCEAQRLFHSERFSCLCSFHLGERIRDSPTAAKYFDRDLTQFPRRRGKVGYMLGKILKSDWGDDGVFLGILVDYREGQMFKVMYMDGDDEWGVFKRDFTVFDLEDGGSRAISWFDLSLSELQAAGPHKKRLKPQLTPAELQEKESRKKTAEMMDRIFEKLVANESPVMKKSASGAFTSAFLQSSGMGSGSDVKQESKKLVKRGISKRPLDQTDGSTGWKKLQKVESVARTKRARPQMNGTIETQPAMKKAKNKVQEKDEKTGPIWNSPAAPPEGAVGTNGSAMSPDPSPAAIHTPLAKKSKMMHVPTSGDRAQPQPQLGGVMSPRVNRNPTNVPNQPTTVIQVDRPATTLNSFNIKPSAPPENARKLSRSASSASFASPVVTSPSVRKPSGYSSVEIGLEMQQFISLLENLTQSKERIAKATQIATSVAYCGGAKRVIDAVLVQIQEPVGSERKVALFYLIDSILQFALKDKTKAPLGKSTGETVIFLELVEQRLKDLVETLSGEYDSYSKMEKVLELWKERQLYSEASMDRALDWLHEKAHLHARFIEDDRLRSEGRVPYYIRSTHGPHCHRVILTHVFGSVGTLSSLAGRLSVPEELAQKQLERFEKSDWDALDDEIDSQIRAYRRRRRPDAVAVPEEAPEEGEIPAQPPLPRDSPPEDVDDPNFVPPLPSDDEDPNFVPPLPSSPPPSSSERGRDEPGHRRYRDASRERPVYYGDRSSEYRSRRYWDGRRDYSSQGSAERDWYRGKGRYESYRHEMYPRQPTGPPPPSMPRLPHSMSGHPYPYTHSLQPGRPNHSESYPSWHPPRRQW